MTAVEALPSLERGGDLPPGRRLGRRNIIRHYVSDPKDVDFGGEEGVFHVMVTAWLGDVVGQLIRWVWSDGEVGYEVRIDGLDDNGGFSDACALTIRKCGGLALVARDLRYEWEIIAGVYKDEGVVWSVE